MYHFLAKRFHNKAFLTGIDYFIKSILEVMVINPNPVFMAICIVWLYERFFISD